MQLARGSESSARAARPARLELVERRDQRLGNVPPAVGAERCVRSSSWPPPPRPRRRTAVVILDPGLALGGTAASTAHGETASIASRDVRRAEPAGEHHATLLGARRGRGERGRRLPGQVDDGSRPARRRGAGRRRGRGGRPRGRRAGRGRRRSRARRRRTPPRGARCRAPSSSASVRRGLSRARMKPSEVGARLDRDVDVLLPGKAADLDERAREQLGELRAGVGRAHQRRADEDRVRAGELGGGALCARRDRGLGDRGSGRGARRRAARAARRGRSRRSRGRGR